MGDVSLRASSCAAGVGVRPGQAEPTTGSDHRVAPVVVVGNDPHGSTWLPVITKPYPRTFVSHWTAIRVRFGWCPLRQRVEYSVWDGGTPVVPAVAFLRSLVDSEGSLVALKAYALAQFFRFLAGRRHPEADDPDPVRIVEPPISFWDVRYEDVEDYKHDLLRRVRARTSRSKTSKRVRGLSHSTADRYLLAVHQLVEFWMEQSLTGAVLSPRVRSRGALSHLSHLSARSARGSAFRVFTPRKYRHRGPPGLSLEWYVRVWHLLESRRPVLPEILERQPASRAERRARVAVERSHDRRTLLFLRDKALWAFLLASGFRKGEAVRVRVTDIGRDVHTGGLYAYLLDRPEDAYLSELKGRPGRAFIGHTPRFLQHLTEWQAYGPELAARRRRVTGVPEHPMLFCNGDGGPLTLNAVDYLFHRIARKLGIRETGVRFSPHVARHTISSILKSSGVPLVFRMAFFRHLQPDTTERYGAPFEVSVEAAIRRFHEATQTSGVDS